jgi:hypothetical protein
MVCDKCKRHLMHHASIITIAHHGAWLLMKFGFCQHTKFNGLIQLMRVGYNWTISKWLELELDYNSEITIYEFLNIVINMFGVLIEVLITKVQISMGNFKSFVKNH